MKHGLTATNSAAADADVCRRIIANVDRELRIIALLKARKFNDIVLAGRLAEALDVVGNVHHRATRTVLLDIARAKKSMLSSDGFDALVTLMEYVQNSLDAVLRYERDIRLDCLDAQAELEEIFAQ